MDGLLIKEATVPTLVVADRLIPITALYADIQQNAEEWQDVILPTILAGVRDAAEWMTWHVDGGVTMAFELQYQVKAAGVKVGEWEGPRD